MLLFPKCIAISDYAASFEVQIYTQDSLHYGTANVLINKNGFSSINVFTLAPEITTNLKEDIIKECIKNIPVLFENKV